MFSTLGSTDVAGAERLLDMSVDAGVDLVDTADVYFGDHAEETLGQALTGRTDRLLVATKARMPMGEDPTTPACRATT